MPTDGENKPETAAPQPAVAPAAGSASRVSELKNQLKENESQRTEVTSYINQLSIQVHRWKLRLQTLQERQAKLQFELEEASRGQ